MHVVADNCSEELVSFIDAQGLEHEETHLGNISSFKHIINQAINLYNNDDIIYFVEDDYLHLPGSKQAIIEGLAIADYVTLYDHLDQYMTYTLKRRDAAPLNRFGLHRWRIFVTEHSHWREAPSTPMTFATHVKTLKEDYKILMHHPKSIRHPKRGCTDSFTMFLRLTKQRSLIDALKVFPTDIANLAMVRGALAIFLNNFALFRKKRLLISSVPGLSTHCEPHLLSPITDWTKI